jgi:hypothetical protein
MSETLNGFTLIVFFMKNVYHKESDRFHVSVK